MWKLFRRNKKTGDSYSEGSSDTQFLLDSDSYAPHAGWQPVDYRRSTEYQAECERFDDKTRDFLSKCNPDAYMGAFQDALIRNRGRKEKIRLIRQRYDHVNVIEIIDMIKRGDRLMIEKAIQRNAMQYEELTKRLQLCQRIHDRGTAFDESAEDQRAEGHFPRLMEDTHKQTSYEEVDA